MLSEMARFLHAHRVQSLNIITVCVWGGGGGGGEELPWSRLVPACDTNPAVIAVEKPM